MTTNARHYHDFRKDPRGPGHLCAVCGCRATPENWPMSLTALSERKAAEAAARLKDRALGVECRHEWVLRPFGVGCRYCRATGTETLLLAQANTLEAQYEAAYAHDEAYAQAHPEPDEDVDTTPIQYGPPHGGW